MAEAIRNPAEWLWDQVKAFSRHIGRMAGVMGSDTAAAEADLPHVRKLALRDLREALRAGIKDFGACRTDVLFICVLYPVAGLFLMWVASEREWLPLVFPLIAGFALVGPVAAIGLYEMSRRREMGEPVSWTTALRVLTSPSIGAIFVLGLFLLAVFVAWLIAARMVYDLTLGPGAPVSIAAFASDVLTTAPGWWMIVIGFAVGFVFAALVLATSVVSFPLLLDRPVGLPVAVLTSVRVARRNPFVIAVWGLTVAGALVIGTIPIFLGLIFVMPVLGHATWHLYRRAVSLEGKGEKGG